MNTRPFSLLVLMIVVLFGLYVAADMEPANAQTNFTFTLVSAASDGTPGNSVSWEADISDDGRYVAFRSSASNLVTNDTNESNDIFVYDHETQEVSLVSIASDGSQANRNSASPVISSNGRYVAFWSGADNLVPNDTNESTDVFVHDRETGETTRVSVSSDGTQGDANSGYNYDVDGGDIAISGDGRFVAFPSYADNLVDTPSTVSTPYMQLYLHDRQTGETKLISLGVDGEEGSGSSDKAVAMSADGRYIAFYSEADDLVDGDTNYSPDMFVYDQQTGLIERASIAPDGTQLGAVFPTASISSDGKYVVFETEDIFVYNRETRQTTRASIPADSPPIGPTPRQPAISADGRYIVFRAYNLLAEDTTPYARDIYLHDRQTGKTTLISKNTAGEQADGKSTLPAISSQGRFVSFLSYAKNLADTGSSIVDRKHVFLLDRIGQVESDYSITGRVVNQDGAPLDGVTISLDRQEHTLSDRDGRFLLTNLVTDTYSIVPTAPGYSFAPASRTVSVPPNGLDQDFVGTLTVPDTQLPQVENVQPCYEGVFWPVSVINFENHFTAQVDWKATTPEYVTFDLNGYTHNASVSADGTAEHTYTLGSDVLRAEIIPVPNGLNVTAHPQSGRPSRPYLHTLYGFDPFQSWLPSSFALRPHVPTAGCPETALQFHGGWEWEFPWDGQITPPNVLPYVGGKPFGVNNPVIRFEESLSTEGAFTVEGFGGGEILVAGQEVSGKVAAGGDGRVSATEGKQLESAELSGTIEGELEAVMPVVELICRGVTSGVCPLRKAEQIPAVGRLIRWFNEQAKFQASFEPSLSLASELYTAQDGWKWNSLDGNGQFGTTLALVVDLLDVLEAKGYGGGTPNLSLGLVPDPGLKDVVIELVGGVELSAFGFSTNAETVYEWEAPLQTNHFSGNYPVRTSTQFTDWRPTPRDYSKDLSRYAVFRGKESNVEQLSKTSTVETLFASNVYPRAQPDIAQEDGDVPILVWVHDDLNKPHMQGQEIYASRRLQMGWTTPTAVTDDTLQDFNPQVAYDGNGNAVVLWERVRSQQTVSNTLDVTYTKSIEIAYAVWNQNNGWSDVSLLTDNNALDHSPLLVNGSNGKLMAVWRQNAAGSLLAPESTPDTLYVSFWNGTQWSTPQIVASGLDNLLEVSAAYHNDEAQLVYSQDTDGALSTRNDVELFGQTWNGSQWSAPTRLTSSSHSDTSPTVLYDGQGELHLIWHRDDELRIRLGSLSGDSQAIIQDETVTLRDYEAKIAEDGRIAILWQGISNQGRDIYYAVYDAIHNTLSHERQLTYDRPLEHALSAELGEGSLTLAYLKDELVTGSMEVSPTLSVDGVTTFGQSDLYVLNHSFGSDLALTDSDVRITPTNPSPGTEVTVHAELHNQGDLAVTDPQVAFYNGNPTSGGTLIGSVQSVQGTVAAGSSITVNTSWTVPSENAPFTIYTIADPNNSVSEQNENNNEAKITTVLPDLTVSAVDIDYGSGQHITLTAMISNTGVVDSSRTTVDFRLNDPVDGTILGQSSVESIRADQQKWSSVVADVTEFQTDRHLVYAVVDPDQTVREADESNNKNWGTLGLLPDLALNSTHVVTRTGSAGDTIVSAWVYNLGSRDASNVKLGIYDTYPSIDSIPLAETHINVSSEGAETAELHLALSRSGFYLGVNADSSIPERNISNNTILIGHPQSRVFLPVIMR